MNELIVKNLKEIEQHHRVKVLYAVESGSRAWGFPSKDSDYDVRFIYIHEPEWYLSIDPQGIGSKRDVIELPINDLLDISGWELTKALRLFRKSNPPLLEWLKSEIVYFQDPSFVEGMKEMEAEIFYPNANLYHYLNMAKSNFRENLQGNDIKIKKYFYALRPVLACKWIEEYQTVPPIEFQELLTDLIPEGTLRNDIELLLKRKKAGDELDKEPRIESINLFLKEEIVRLEAYCKTLTAKPKDSTKALNEFFRTTLERIFSLPLLKR
ncbi:MAG TPA: nucleotidyltransferase domain-containing protein [Planococcus sp. (in: firmicutes)]|nr:nucleotidyltransferase domain-containing protein [Planococcus sp. (in: firmicutes)]